MPERPHDEMGRRARRAVGRFSPCWFLLLLAACIAHPPPDLPLAPVGPEGPIRPSADPTAELAPRWDVARRLTIPVMVDGVGPFPFMLDTGASRTVLSEALAQRLSLPRATPVMLDAAGGRSLRPAAAVSSLSVAGREIHHFNAPLLDGRAMGAVGILGLDAFRGRTVALDFARRRVTIGSGRADGGVGSAAVKALPGGVREGLVLFRATLDGKNVNVMVDSGAEASVGNAALVALLTARDRQGPRIVGRGVIISVAGERIRSDIADVGALELGNLRISNLQIALAQLHTWDALGIGDAPTVLLGMDALRAFERVAVDFRRGWVEFDMRRDRRTATFRFAATAPLSAARPA